MVARFTGRNEGFEVDAARPRDSSQITATRIGDLLPEILRRYGLESSAVATAAAAAGRRPETNRPGIAGERRRVG